MLFALPSPPRVFPRVIGAIVNLWVTFPHNKTFSAKFDQPTLKHNQEKCFSSVRSRKVELCILVFHTTKKTLFQHWSTPQLLTSHSTKGLWSISDVDVDVSTKEYILSETTPSWPLVVTRRRDTRFHGENKLRRNLLSVGEDVPVWLKRFY